jgi:hypothetical protein
MTFLFGFAPSLIRYYYPLRTIPQEANTLAYFAWASMTKKKRFKVQATAGYHSTYLW